MTVSNSSQLLTQFLSSLVDMMKVEKACFLEFDEQRGLLSGSAYVGIEGMDLVARLGEGMAGWVAEQGVCMVINDFQQSPELSDELANALAESSFLASPLYFEQRLLGVIILAGKRDASPFDFNDRQLLVTLLPLVSLTVYHLLTTQPKQEPVQELKNQLRLIQAENEELAHYIRCLTQIINCALLVVDMEGQITHVNPAGEKILKAPVSQLEGESLAQILGPNIQQMVLSCAQESVEINKQIEFTDSQGKKIAAHLSCCSYRDKDQRQQGFLVAFRELGKLPEEQDREDQLASIRELTAGIAHEIRNPLAGIMTTAETLKETLDPQDSRREYLERIINEINRMNQFLIRFFAFARPQKLQKEPCSLPQIIDRIIDLEARNIGQHNISVIKDYQPSLPTVKLDANQIQQVFLNLILNSVQAMPNGGELKTSVWVNGQAEKSPGYIQVSISDTGVGIKPDNLSKIFAPFYTTKPKGVGLGLSVSHQIIKEHGGKVGVNSVLGQGTTFSISLPIGN